MPDPPRPYSPIPQSHNNNNGAASGPQSPSSQHHHHHHQYYSISPQKPHHNPSEVYSIPIHRPNGNGNTMRNRANSILDNPIGSFRGVNSLSRFASSFNRAQSFKTIEHDPRISRSFFTEHDDEVFDPRTLGPSVRGATLSTVLPRGDALHHLLESQTSNEDLNSNYYNYNGDEDAIDDSYSVRPASIYSSSYGAIHHESPYSEFRAPRESISIRQVENNKGKVITVIAGQSTAPQTIFNSVNVLIGIGLLALPLGLKHSGWLIGVPALSACAFLTFRAATWLSLCMDTDPTLMTYADLAYVTFGINGRVLVSVLLSLDLLANGVSLVVLFSDSLNAIFPSIPVFHFKILAFFVLTPPSFLTLNFLSFVSLGGILSTIGVVLTVLVSGLIKSDSPGSLLQFAPTNVLPESGADLLIAIGMLMAPFGGHSVFPNLKTDMRHPHRFEECLSVTYIITYFTDITMACIGFLMFGAGVKDEITKSVLLTEGYPSWIYYAICGLTAFVPFSKVALNAGPIAAILDLLTGCDVAVEKSEFSQQDTSPWWKPVVKFSNKIIVNAAFVFIAIIFPEFEKIIAFVGSGLCFTLCLILPACFYLHLCGDKINRWERFECYVIIVVSAILAVLGVGAAIVY
ncbi:hypothetical protein WICPIJ_005368 [Wickerhamomyces pijperi]|uniref:Amino acid transporter transmembrane domain-containing protein n=1 Tax=Wickerhamomyces pijperi TaxID=599730 RepID=A0A9P8Q6F8_WICPI|nr:hypothetical protein WICPIJ_005368 [Wickerhamomyces pijperi]